MKRLAIACALLFACHREQRSLMPRASDVQRPTPVRVSDLQPGRMQPAVTAMKNPYEGNAFAVSEGQRLYSSYNCAGCHFHGGGGIGPPLMDGEWIYGSSPANIYTSIVQGRPNGMPSFGGKIPPEQIWQIAAYVRS
ncbi:MAG TPA: cytochrome c, partial [Thermoanaerobaculia bacterium]|nr:cytochrome c [Thermoanaerobaculia bacterium]